MTLLDTILAHLPQVRGPKQKKLPFNEKIKWTLIALILFFVMGFVPLYGLGENALQQFEFLSIILGASFGSIISLGIGPLVTSSIVLQLLNGSGLLKFDLTTSDGKKRFQGTQKVLSFFFIIFEAVIYVFMGGLSPEGFSSKVVSGTPIFFQFQLLLVFQLFLGGIMIMFMDEVVSKWGFGSGISLFIAAGVSQSVFIQAFNWLPGPSGLAGVTYAIGAIPALFQSLAAGDPTTAGVRLAALLSTAVIFLVVVYVQSMKVEIPLSFGRIRG